VIDYWAIGFFVITAGIDDAVIRAYIEQLELFGTMRRNGGSKLIYR